jgi:hypothetical protein
VEAPAAHLRLGRHKGELIDDCDVCHTPIVRARRLAPVVLALPLTQAAAQAQLAPVLRAPLRPAVEMARVVDDETNLLVLPIASLGNTERLYLRGADLAIVNSAACALLAQAERLECPEKIAREIAASASSEPIKPA